MRVYNIDEILGKDMVMVFGVRGGENECLIGQIVDFRNRHVNLVQDMTATYEFCQNTNMLCYNGRLYDIPLQKPFRQGEKTMLVEGIDEYLTEPLKGKWGFFVYEQNRVQ